MNCDHYYVIRDGITRFLAGEDLEGLNSGFARFYDRFAPFYRLMTRMGMLAFGGNRRARKVILDRLDPKGGSLLEVSIGTGDNLPFLFESPDLDQVFGLDISMGQLRQCAKYIRKKGLPVELFLATAERLPFRDESFDGVLHIGGINFFSDKKAAIDEMIRVAKPGCRIVIADESEQVAKRVARFSRSSDAKDLDLSVPVNLVPDTMEEIKVTDIWKAHGRYHGYCLEFRKPTR
jgi:ubiquinone/menaquinone biosynthesis C-methylase UbiE